LEWIAFKDSGSYFDWDDSKAMTLEGVGWRRAEEQDDDEVTDGFFPLEEG